MLRRLIASKYRKFNVYKDARCIIAIHNLSHQGVEPAYTFDNLGVPGDWYGALEWIFPTWARRHALDKGEAVNILKGAIVTSDRVVTVSPVRASRGNCERALTIALAVAIAATATATALDIQSCAPGSFVRAMRSGEPRLDA